MASSSFQSVPSEEQEDMAAREGSSFLYIDDNGDTIAPEEETSWLMALGIRNHGGGGEADNDNANGLGGVDQDEKPSCSSSFLTSADEVPYFEDPDAFERERLLAEKRLEDVLQRAAIDSGSDDGAAVEEGRQASCDKGEDTLDDLNDDDDDGAAMGCRTFSREATHNDDEWILERIMDRRILREPNTKTTDYRDIYDDFGNKETVIVSAGRIEYLCKWKWYVEPSWEGKELLEDEGFARECRAYDETASKAASTSKTISAVIAKVAPLWSDLHPEYAVKAKRKKKGVASTYTETVFGDLTPIKAITGLSMDAQAALFKRNHMALYNYGVCATDTQISAFMEEWSSKRKTHRPVLLYHGSQIQNYTSICQNGLRVPKTKRDVVNGQSQGMGIYAAYSPTTSVNFCRPPQNHCRMLLCVALVSPTDSNVKMVPGYCVVFFKSSLILPFVTLDVAWRTTTPTPEITRQIHTYETLTVLSPPKPTHNMAAVERKRRDLYGANDVATEERARAMCKVRSKNILNINRLAEKAAAAAAAGTASSPLSN